MKDLHGKEMFEINGEHKYTIEIDVYENCCITKFKTPAGEDKNTINYHHVIGVLESQKHHMMYSQRESTMKNKNKPKLKK